MIGKKKRSNNISEAKRKEKKTSLEHEYQVKHFHFRGIICTSLVIHQIHPRLHVLLMCTIIQCINAQKIDSNHLSNKINMRNFDLMIFFMIVAPIRVKVVAWSFRVLAQECCLSLFLIQYTYLHCSIEDIILCFLFVIF